MTYVSNISTPERDNLAGILQLRIARVADVERFPRIIGGRIQGDIVFKDGAGFAPWEVVQETGGFGSESVDSIEGVYRDGRLEFAITHIDPAILERMERDRFIVYYLDGNLTPVVFGSPERPLLFRFSQGTGSIGSGRNECRGTFYSTAPGNRAVYRGSVPDFLPMLVVRFGGLDGEVLATVSEGQSITLDGDFYFTETMLPLLPSYVGRYATINYFKNGNPMSVQAELGRTLVIVSDFSFEFDVI